jgi:NADH dehydrogenase (ubiquinone) 1 alpha subcomplex subunit 6
MYSLNLPVSTLRTKIRQEFERHRYVNQLRTVDVLLFSSHQEYQVRLPTTIDSLAPIKTPTFFRIGTWHMCNRPTGFMDKKNLVLTRTQETLNYWKQTSHVLKYFRAEEDPKARLQPNFISGFLEVSVVSSTHLTQC